MNRPRFEVVEVEPVHNTEGERISQWAVYNEDGEPEYWSTDKRITQAFASLRESGISQEDAEFECDF